jgi:hypothetical protein
MKVWGINPIQATLPVKNQHSHDQRQDQGSEPTRESQPHALSPEARHFGRAQIAPVLPNSQNACGGERFRTVPLILGQLTQQYRISGRYCASCAQLFE